ncbi:MAG TPA: hypothetical protein VM582_09670 [Candidatus Thermoplasmatota archaeon]|nr:hypothetical protein [Candidatus Thermoplasmatota archaeon]
MPEPTPNPGKPVNNPADVNEPSNTRPPSKPTPSRPPDPQEAGAGESENIENVGE